MLTSRRHQAGVTLVELMIAVAISLIALSALLTVYSVTARHSSGQLYNAHLHQQLHSVLQLMSADLRRSGYWHFDPQRQSPADNPFSLPGNRLRVAAYPGESENSCVLFGYDLDRDGRVGRGDCEADGCPADSDADNVEQFGYRLRGGALQMRFGGTVFSCDSGYWQSVTDPNISITGLAFVVHTECTNLDFPGQACQPGAARLVTRAVLITLTAQTARPNATAVTVSAWTRVKNHRIQGATDAE